MPSPAPLQPGTYYHLYNRGTNHERIFLEDENYRYFLRLYKQYVLPVAETFAYRLLPNHFHLLVRTRTEEEIEHLERLTRSEGVRRSTASQAFTNLFSTYTMAFNKRYGRTGSLFEHPFHRIVVDHDAYFTRLIAYIHRNPSRHGFCDDFRRWKYSSYAAVLSSGHTHVACEQVLAWFGGVERYRTFHAQFVDDDVVARLAPDDASTSA
ncbi:MAG: transposase [Candidatus Brachytrichaceae bacterium NZ_4S206]|jgi:REP element-mobilizing transposase RayT